jgi:hypothetical protein
MSGGCECGHDGHTHPQIPPWVVLLMAVLLLLKIASDKGWI